MRFEYGAHRFLIFLFGPDRSARGAYRLITADLGFGGEWYLWAFLLPNHESHRPFAVPSSDIYTFPSNTPNETPRTHQKSTGGPGRCGRTPFVNTSPVRAPYQGCIKSPHSSQRIPTFFIPFSPPKNRFSIRDRWFIKVAGVNIVFIVCVVPCVRYYLILRNSANVETTVVGIGMNKNINHKGPSCPTALIPPLA